MSIKPSGKLKFAPKSGNISRFPNHVVEHLEVERDGEIPYVKNAGTILLYNPKMTAKDIKQSLKILDADIDLRSRISEEDKFYKVLQQIKELTTEKDRIPINALFEIYKAFGYAEEDITTHLGVLSMKRKVRFNDDGATIRLVEG